MAADEEAVILITELMMTQIGDSKAQQELVVLSEKADSTDLTITKPPEPLDTHPPKKAFFRFPTFAEVVEFMDRRLTLPCVAISLQRQKGLRTFFRWLTVCLLVVTSTLHALKYVIAALDTTAISRIFIANFFTSALVFSALLELQTIAEKRKCNPPELTLAGSVDADAGDLCSLSLALLDSSPRGLYMLAPGWLCVVVTSTCSCVLQTPVAADALDVATTIYAVICVVLIYVIFLHYRKLQGEIRLSVLRARI